MVCCLAFLFLFVSSMEKNELFVVKKKRHSVEKYRRIDKINWDTVKMARHLFLCGIKLLSLQTMQEKIVSLTDVSLTLSSRNLFRGLSFSLSGGEMLGVCGSSGCGKTSLLRLVLGFVEMDGGVVEICGERLTAESVRRCRSSIAYLPQDLFFSQETVRDAVQMAFSLKVNDAVKFSKEKLMKEWARLSLKEELYDMPLQSISGGQRQRVMLASCALLGKKLWLLDEPTSALDAESVLNVVDFICRARQHNVAVIAVSHDQRLLSACSSVLDMSSVKEKIG